MNKEDVEKATTKKVYSPTDPYEDLLLAAINEVKKNLAPNPTLDKSAYTFPNNVENSFRVLTFFKFEVLHKLRGVKDWPRTRETQLLKTKLAHDLIIWYKNERPDALELLRTLF